MLILIFQAIYFVLPAYLANMMPVFFAKLGWLKSLGQPINEPLFGTNKTWRGIISAIFGGIIISGIQALLLNFVFFINLSIYSYHNWLIFGFLAGLGAILGDLFKSFLKRKKGIKSGGSWPVFDQLDFIVGFFIFTYWLARPDWQIIVTAIILTLILHPLTNIIGYALGIKKVWW